MQLLTLAFLLGSACSASAFAPTARQQPSHDTAVHASRRELGGLALPFAAWAATSAFPALARADEDEVTTPSGLKVKFVKRGDKAAAMAKMGSPCVVDYTGWVRSALRDDGARVDRSRR